ncbi:uncharacterized protein LOC127881164 [Dreissena polymorpha]|uniref:Uncharacterized protein n=1 Tax=Dreissena polymorpha TaxID=45954 RepID=A0A9D4K0W0_DREPO|nr:uncharacterized protein LOC127881164 [Dreissena polymorpha]XP_052284806.1 uncharacterized protein LOC127881164 [Dreissena polymorpha]KAH3827298.1 hypothetical protein DPMN_129229 [Dreissena polymorpha]
MMMMMMGTFPLRSFPSFFGRSNDRFPAGSVFQDLHDLQKDMEAMFQNLEDLNFSVGFHSPPLIYGQVPPHRQTPRDMMLKDSLDEPRVEASTPQSVAPRVEAGTPKSVTCEPCSLQRLAAEKSTFQPTFNFSARWGDQDGHFFSSATSRSTRFIRHPDGSTEKIDKVTENGRTCTTVTRTGVDGVTSTNTTCDLPSPDSGGTPMLPPSPVTHSGPSVPPNLTAASVPRDPEPGMSAEDTSFFNKLFGFKEASSGLTTGKSVKPY